MTGVGFGCRGTAADRTVDRRVGAVEQDTLPSLGDWRWQYVHMYVISVQ